MRKYFLFLLYLFITHWSNAQENSFVFSHLKDNDGLSDNIINCFLKDSRGFIWVGTYNGFNRYDGANFLTYKKRKGTNSMVNEVVHSLCEDRKGNIWGSTDNGVFCFEPATDKFINYNLRSFGNGKFFYNILCDKEGNVWTAADASLFRFNSAEKKYEEVFRFTNNRDSVSYFHIRKNGVVPDPTGNGLWLATRSGLAYYDTRRNTVINFNTLPGDSLFNRRSVSALCASPRGSIWFFDNERKDFVEFNPGTRKIIQKINISPAIPTAEGGTIFEDRNKRLWFASWTYHVLVVELGNGNRMHSLTHQPTDSRSIASPFFWAGFEDEDGTVWLATQSGISRCNPERNVYKQFNLPQKIPELAGTYIQVAEEDPEDKSFWIITRSNLLVHYIPETDKYELFDMSKAPPSVYGTKPGPCNYILFNNGHVIITTYTGAWQIKKGTRNIVPYSFLPADYKDFLCSEIVFDGDSVIYCNDGKRLLYWNYRENRTDLIRFLPSDSMPTDRTIMNKVQLSAGRKIWVSSLYGYVAYKNGANTLSRVRIVRDEAKEAGQFMSLDTDKHGNLWVLNKGVGLYRYHPQKQSVDFWDETDGLPSNRMHKSKPDLAGRIWSMFYNKISVFIPESGRFYNFKLPIGESSLNYYNYISRRSNGNMFGSISNELVEFFPDRIVAVPGKQKPQISQLIVNNKNFHIIDDNKIVLGPKENTIRLRFGTLTDKSIFPYDIEYMLEGSEENWTTSVGNAEALYNNLHPGSYVFKVRARGKNNAWQTEEASLFITIRAPFYKTTWFLIGVSLLVTLGIIAFYRHRLSQREKLMVLENKAQMLEKEKVMVMYDNLKQQLNPHFLFNSLTSLSGLIETDQKLASNFLEQMSDIYRYILLNGDNETVALKDEIAFVNAFIKLQKTRFRKGLEVNINVPDEFQHLKIAPVTLQNLIENAIKHNKIDAAFPLVIDMFVDGDYLVVRNNLQKKTMVETSNKKGLAQFITLYKYLSSKPVLIEESDQFFQIKIPLI